MRKTFNKLLSILLVLILITSAIPISVLAASTSHSHPVCGSSCSCTSYHGSKNWTAWDGKTKITSGYYYLENDVVFDSTFIHKSGYSIYLCLNGNDIICSDTVFDIYSYTGLIICDCKGTGKIESTGSCWTISNNGAFQIYGGTISNNYQYGSTVICWDYYSSLYTYGGKIESLKGSAISVMPDSDIYIRGGNIQGYYSAIDSNGGSGSNGRFEMKAGNISCTYAYASSAVDLEQSDFIMSGGYIDGDVYISSGTTSLSGGTINGELNTSSDTVTVTGGSCSLFNMSGECNVSAGTFTGSSTTFGGTNNTVSGGNFTNSEAVQITAQTWIYGGYFNIIKVFDAPLYLSGLPEIDTIQIGYPNYVSAQNIDQSGSYTGDLIHISLDNNISDYVWKNGDVVIKNVKSDAVAQKFVLAGEDSRWMYLERSGNNLVLRILPHGTWGDNVTWGIKDGVLTVSGTGALDYTDSGNKYPWGKYTSQITKIVVEPGVTRIPAYAFEYCEKAETIILPETLTALNLNAFNDCYSLNNLVIPSSVLFIEGSSNSGLPAFLRCNSLTDMYYTGTAEEWNMITHGWNIINYSRTMTKHFLEYHETTATCTESGTQAYYQFADTSVYGGYYDEDKKPIVQPKTIPALGHRVVVQNEKQVEPFIIDNSDVIPFEFKDGYYHSANIEDDSSSELMIYALYPATLKIEVEDSYEHYVYYYHNNNSVSEDYYFEGVETLTLNLKAGDTVSIINCIYSSNNYTSGEGIKIKLTYDMPAITYNTYIYAETVEPDCINGVICDCCQAVITQPLGHRIIGETEIEADPIIVENNDSVPFTLTNGTYYSNNMSSSSASTLTIKAEYDCKLTLNYGVSSEQNYDKLLINHNNSNKATISGSVSNRTLTLNLVAGDTVTVRYSKDGSVNSGQDRGWVSLSYDYVTVVGETDIPADTVEHRCSDELICDYCKMEVQGIVTHQMGDWFVVTDATCTEDGSKKRECDNCEHFETEVIEANSHNHNAVVTTPTCTEKGYTTYTCECGDSYVADYVDATGHSHKSEITTPATHTTAGVMTYTCHCGDTYTESIEKTAEHNHKSVVTSPTCTEKGYTTYTCECGNSYVADYVDATGHVWDKTQSEDNLTRPTDTEKGYYTYTCKTDSTHTMTEEVESADYTKFDEAYETMAAYLNNPDITEEAKNEIIASIKNYAANNPYMDSSGNLRRDLIESEQNTIAEATAVVAEIIKDVDENLSNCKSDKHFVINYVPATDATCTEPGTKKGNCYYCGTEVVKDDENAPALGHDMIVDNAVAPDCVKDGLTEGSHCSRCNDVTVDQETIPATGHKHTPEITTPATHTTAGIMTYTCHCGDTYTRSIDKIAAHNYISVVTDPTCTEQGYTTYTCECGNTYVDDYVDAAGHNDASNDGNCDVCSEHLCDHACHKTGITGFFWKIVCFFNRIFGLNKFCTCGNAHY